MILVGLSLSFCIKDIIQGVVPLEDVAFITTGTCARTFEDWDEVFKVYDEHYWKGHIEAAHEVVWDLIQEGRILQPRLEGLCPIRFTPDEPLVHKGQPLRRHWMLNVNFKEVATMR